MITIIIPGWLLIILSCLLFINILFEIRKVYLEINLKKLKGNKKDISEQLLEEIININKSLNKVIIDNPQTHGRNYYVATGHWND